MRPGIAFYSSSTTLSRAELVAGVAAISAQLVEDFCPAWGKLPIEATFYGDPKEIPPGTPTVVIADRCDVDGALAYHTEQAGGLVTGLVGVLTCQEDSESWTSAASHEALEAAHNPYVNGWTTATGHGGHRKVSNEDADPVQDGVYKKNGVEVSNFVTPEWFDDTPPEGAKFDFLGVLTAPFTKTAGGYFEIDTNGVVSQLGMKKRHRTRVRPEHRAAHAAQASV